MTTDTTDVAYTYDADGIRASSNVDGDVTYYVMDKNRDYAQVLEERDDLGATIVEYVYGDDLISQERGGQDSYYLYDGQMSTRALTDDTETVTDTYIYDAFGSLTYHAGTTVNNYLYTGEQIDPNAGFYYLRARYYDQSTGRFVTTDPWGGSTFDPGSLHKYLYTQNDPINNIDPSGYFTLQEVITTTAVLTNLTLIADVTIGYLGYQALKLDEDGLPDAAIFSFNESIAKRGFGADFGFDVLYHFKSGRFYAFADMSVGLTPLSYFRKFRNMHGPSFTFGGGIGDVQKAPVKTGMR